MAISIDDLLRRAVESKASDLHLKVGRFAFDGAAQKIVNADGHIV